MITQNLVSGIWPPFPIVTPRSRRWFLVGSPVMVVEGNSVKGQHSPNWTGHCCGTRERQAEAAVAPKANLIMRAWPPCAKRVC